MNDKMLDKLVNCDVSGIDLKKVEPRSFCEGCVQGKATRHKPKPLGEIRSTRRLEKVHSDVCGPMQTASISGKKYMVTFVDDYSRSCAVYFMVHRVTPLRCSKSFMRRLVVRVENELVC